MQGKAPAAATPAATKPAEANATMAANRRRIYLNIRIEELRAELARLIEERKALAAKK